MNAVNFDKLMECIMKGGEINVKTVVSDYNYFYEDKVNVSEVISFVASSDKYKHDGMFLSKKGK